MSPRPSGPIGFRLFFNRMSPRRQGHSGVKNARMSSWKRGANPRKIHSGKAGFSLPLVLTIVAVLTTAYVFSLTSLIQLTETTKLAQTRAEFERHAMTAEARLSYLITTEPFCAALLNIGGPRNLAGNNTVAANTCTQAAATESETTQVVLDSRPYFFFQTQDTASPYLAEIQDEAGLFNLYYASSDQLTRLFQQFAGMGDIDATNLAVEMQTYLAESTTLHQPIRRPAAIFSRLPDMADYITPRMWNTLSDKITTYSDDNRFNVNTAPPDVMGVMFNIDPETAGQIVENREGAQNQITRLADVGLISPTPNRAYTFSNGRFRFTLIDPESGLTYRSTLILTPTDVSRPLWIENPRTLVTTPPNDVDPDVVKAFPNIPDLSS